MESHNALGKAFTMNILYIFADNGSVELLAKAVQATLYNISFASEECHHGNFISLTIICVSILVWPLAKGWSECQTQIALSRTS